MFCSLGPEHPSVGSRVARAWISCGAGGAEPRGDPPVPCSVLPCHVRDAVVISFPSWAVARLCHDTPFPWHHGPSALLPAWIWGAQRDAKPRVSPERPPWDLPLSPVARPLPCPSHFQGKLRAEPTPCFPPSFRLLPPQLQALSPPSHPSFITEPAVTHVQPHPPPASCSSRRCWG